MAMSQDYGFKLDKGTRIVHGKGVNSNQVFPPDLDIPGVMHVFRSGNA